LGDDGKEAQGDDTFKVDHESEVKYWAEWCLPPRASPGHPTDAGDADGDPLKPRRNFE